MMGLLIALISGALMSIQGVFNTQVTKASGVWSASAFVQFLALIVCLGVWACVERSPLLNVFRVEPKYMRSDHLHGNPQHGVAGTRQSSYVYCDLAAGCGVCDRALRNVRRGEAASGAAQGNRYGDRHCGCRDI